MSLRISDFETRYPRAENVEVIKFLKNRAPSAHPDLIEYLGKCSFHLDASNYSREYCFDFYYTSSAIIYAIAIGQRNVVFRLPVSIIGNAIYSGGVKFKNIGASWVEFNPFTIGQVSAEFWFEVAYKYAVSLYSNSMQEEEARR